MAKEKEEGSSGIGKFFEFGGELMGNEWARDAAREAARARQAGIRDAQASGNKYYDRLDTEYGADSENYRGDLEAWRDLAGKDGLELQDFDDSVDIASFLDPAVDYRQKQEADSISQSAANAGGMFSGSGATAKSLQDRSQAIASDEWGKAYSRADKDMTGKYSRFIDKFNADKSNEARKLAGARGMFDQSKLGRDDSLSAFGGRTNLDMTTIRQLAGLDADVLDNDAAYYGKQFKTGGKLAGEVAQTAVDNRGNL